VRFNSKPDAEGVTAYIHGDSAEIAPETLAAPAKILIGNVPGFPSFRTEAAALAHWRSIVKKRDEAAAGLTPAPEHVVDWTLYAEGVSVGEALKKCGKMGLRTCLVYAK